MPNNDVSLYCDDPACEVCRLAQFADEIGEWDDTPIEEVW